jgi:hypothetical protein
MKDKTMSFQMMSIMAYSISSISMILLNKGFVRIYDSSLNFSILALQTLFGFIVVVLGKQFGFISYPDYNHNIMISWIPLAFLFIGMISTSLLRFVSIEPTSL